MVRPRNARVDAERLDERGPVGAPVRAARVVGAGHVDVDEGDRGLQQLLEPRLGVRLDHLAADAPGDLGSNRPRGDRDRIRTEGEPRRHRGRIDVVLVWGELLVEGEPLLHLLEPLDHRPHRPARRVDVGHLAHQMQQVADRRADGQREVAGPHFEHGVVRICVVEAGDLLHDLPDLGEEGAAVEVRDPPPFAPHVAPLADALPDAVAAACDQFRKAALVVDEVSRPRLVGGAFRGRARESQLVVRALGRRDSAGEQAILELPQLGEPAIEALKGCPVGRWRRPEKGRRTGREEPRAHDDEHDSDLDGGRDGESEAGRDAGEAGREPGVGGAHGWCRADPLVTGGTAAASAGAGRARFVFRSGTAASPSLRDRGCAGRCTGRAAAGRRPGPRCRR